MNNVLNTERNDKTKSKGQNHREDNSYEGIKVKLRVVIALKKVDFIEQP